MPARAGRWELLDQKSDPVPGDPDAVRVQAKYYTDMAQTILDEAHRLKALGEQKDLPGKFWKPLRKQLADLADDVHNAHKRYATVGTALGPFAKAMDEAKTGSWQALQSAINEDSNQTTASNMPNPKPADGKKLTAAQSKQVTDRNAAAKAATQGLQKAKDHLAAVMSDFQKAGKKAKDAINDADNDKLRDHHHWYDVVVKIVKVIVELANYAIVILAIASLLIPGLDVLGALYFLSYVALAGDLLLFATGNGSLLDLGIDILGIATLGLGSAAVKAGEELGEGAEKFAMKYAARNYKEFAKFAEKEMPTLTKSAKQFAVEVAEQGKNARTYLKTVANMGEKDFAAARSSVDALVKAFPRSTKLLEMQQEMNRLARINRVAVIGGTAPVAGNTALSSSNLPYLENHKPYSETYDSGKENNSNPLKKLPTHVENFKWSDSDMNPKHWGRQGIPAK